MNPQISGYRITTQLYESAQSLIYRAQRESDGNPVVLKMLQDDYPTPERIAQFHREHADQIDALRRTICCEGRSCPCWSCCRRRLFS